jgi:hypothetical protein
LNGGGLATRFDRDGEFANIAVLAAVERLTHHHVHATRKETAGGRVADDRHGAAVVRRSGRRIVNDPAAPSCCSRTYTFNDVAWTLDDGRLGVAAHGDGEGAGVHVLTAIDHSTHHGGDPNRQCGADGRLAGDVVI